MARFALALVVAVAACSGHGNGTIDRTLGIACTSNDMCDHTCFTDPRDFPGGICSNGCASDADCPADAVCAGVSGGVCLYECPPFDCGRLGGGWGCHSVDAQGGGGKVNVCIGN